MECVILLPPDARTHVKKNENSCEQGEEKKIAQQQQQEQQVKALKFSPFDSDHHSVRMSRKNSSGSDLAANYVLRENPKKTKRFGDAKEQNVCKECGKGFQSLKALCGHMASHSDKDKMAKKFQEKRKKKKKKKMVMDGHSDTETSGLRQRKSVPKRIRFKNPDVNYSGSSTASGIEQEQQEVAISLMLLSRDSGQKGGLDLDLDLNLNSLPDSSDNNSVVLEAKSSSTDMKRIKVANFDEKKFKSGVGVSVSENSDSGYFRNCPKKIESDVSVDGFFKNGELRKLEVESGSGLDATNKLGISENNKSDQLGKRILVDEEEKDHEENNRGSSSTYELRKRTKNGLYRAEALMGDSYKNEAIYSFKSEFCRNVQKRRKCECLTCNKTFQSHSKINGCCEPICESGENSIEDDNNSTPDQEAKIIKKGVGKTTPIKEDLVERKSGSKKSKGHECPICFRMFKSGQALGGHKRSHFVGGREANSTMVIREEEPPEAEVTVLFDLNLPAQMEEDVNEDVGFMAW